MIVMTFAVATLYPLRYLVTRAYFRNLLSFRTEVYAVRDGVYYKHFRTGQKNLKAEIWRNKLWC